jgi:hypothetical protein
VSKRHKFFWTGIDIETSLDPERIWLAVAEAIAQAKGKIHLTAETPLLKAYDIKGSESIFATSPELTFDVQISDESAGRRAVRTHVMRALLKDGSVPFEPKRMLGQKAYMRFAEALGAHVSQADPAAAVTLRQGPMPDGFPVDALTSRVAPPGTAV